jgi:hypothetical protein
MKISERCRQYENKFSLTPSAIRNTNGWTKYKQYSTPDSCPKIKNKHQEEDITKEFEEMASE